MCEKAFSEPEEITRIYYSFPPNFDCANVTPCPPKDIEEIVFMGKSPNLPVKVGKIFPKIEVFNAQETRLEFITSDTFEALTKVKKLLLQKNQIKTIQSGTFQNLSSLKVLFLQRNQIQTIEAGAFGRLQSLKELRLNHNKISVIPDKLFNSVEQLSELCLQENKIVSFDLNALTVHSELKELKIDRELWKHEVNGSEVPCKEIAEEFKEKCNVHLHNSTNYEAEMLYYALLIPAFIAIDLLTALLMYCIKR